MSSKPLTTTLKTHPKLATGYLTASTLVFTLTFLVTLGSDILAALLIYPLWTNITWSDMSTTALIGGLGLFTALLAACIPYVTAYFTASIIPYPRDVELPRYELSAILAAVAGFLTLTAIWFPIWTPLNPFLAAQIPASITGNATTYATVVLLTLATSIVYLKDDLEKEPAQVETTVSVESTPKQQKKNIGSINTRNSTNQTNTNTAATNTNQASESNASQPTGTMQGFEFNWQDPPNLSFDDFGGMHDVKQTLQDEIIDPLHGDTEKFERLGISIPNLLLYGPPGTGKTYLAKALAGELQYPYLNLSAGELLSQYINASGEQINTLFQEAEQLGNQYGHAIIFLDEIDALLSDRNMDQQHSENKKVVNEFLNHLEGTTDRNTLVIGATNHIDTLDSAATRSGRLGKKIEIPLPDHTARIHIFKAQLQNRPTEHIDEDVLGKLSRQLDEKSAADIGTIVEAAARNTIKRDADKIACQDLEAAVQAEGLSSQ
jgi:ATP-dependent 26S proteasome regulatory subunit